MRIIGYCDYLRDRPIPPSYFAERINIALLGWTGEFFAVAVYSPYHNCDGLVFVDEHPTAEIEMKCQQYYEEELRKDKSEMEEELEQEFDEDDLI